MLTGTASVATLGRAAPTITAFLEEPAELRAAACFQLTAEMHNAAREAVLPPALHPTSPAALSLQAWQVGESPWGPFSCTVCRVSCRSGVRARGFTTGAVASTEAACAALTERLGFPCRQGAVRLNRHYDAVDLLVRDGDHDILHVRALDPEPLGLDDVQYTSTLNLAHTPKGLRLVQVETRHVPSRVERLTAEILRFEPEAWGDRLLDPYRVIAASVELADITLAPVRFVCKPDELAFTGTEPV